ncbi:MAG: hypothetical protein MJ191_06865 [Clostridium sp.]|nr:hypothetical protein [Clostridium sp.]
MENVLNFFQNFITSMATAGTWLFTPIDMGSLGTYQPVWLLTGAGLMVVIPILVAKVLL